MLANPSAKFERPRVHASILTRKAYEHRSVAIIYADEAATMCASDVLRLQNEGRGYTYWTRSRVTALVDRGEMRWVDRHRNGATYTDKAAGQWQKTRSGPVCTMQLVIGAKGRHIPAGQRDNSWGPEASRRAAGGRPVLVRLAL